MTASSALTSSEPTCPSCALTEAQVLESIVARLERTIAEIVDLRQGLEKLSFGVPA